MKNNLKISVLLALSSLNSYAYDINPMEANPTVVALKPGAIYTVGTLAPNYSINNPGEIVNYWIAYEDGSTVPATQAFLKTVKKETGRAGIPGATAATYTYTLYINAEAHDDKFAVMQKNRVGQTNEYKVIYITNEQ